MPWAPKKHKPLGSRTEAERKAAFQRTRNDKERQAFYRSAAWSKRRLQILAERPLCEDCLKDGRDEPATCVDHQVEVRDDWSLRLTPSNLRSLCRSCHNRKTAKSVNARRV